MNIVMKKLIILFVGLVMIQGAARADNDKPIDFSKLPKASQQFVQKYFSGISIALIKMESDFFEKSYEIVFTNGDKVEFDRKGEWTDINCKYTEMPPEVIPAQIREYVAKHYEGVRIQKLERERREYEVELSNGIDLTFNTRFALIDIDY